MKKLLSLLLPLALLLSLTACGEKSADEAARQTPPTLTVTSANACSVTLKSSSYDWTYTQGLQSMTDIACGAHPLDETSRDITPVLEMPFAVSAAYLYTVTLDFGDNSPDSVSLRCWPSDAWGSTVMPSETVTAQRQDNGTFRAELPQSDGIFAVDALWDGSSATYTFCTQAEGSEELHPGAVLSIGESEDIRKIDISWRSGGVNIYTAEQSAQISVKEESAAPLAESEKMVCAIDGDTLRIRFLGDAYRGSYDGEKYLDVGLPAELVSAGHFEEIEVETTDAYAYVSADAQKIKLSTVGGDARVMCANCPEVEIETTSGNAGVVESELGIFVPLLTDAGVTSFHVTLANHSSLEDTIPPANHPYFKEQGCFLKFCDEVRRYTDKPITGVGGLNQPDFVEQQLASGRITCAAMSRQLLADPEWPNKVASGQIKEIHRCVRCNKKCLGGLQQHQGTHCIYEKV